MDTQPAQAMHTAGHQGARTVNADAVASCQGVIALADGIGDTTEAAQAALAAVTAAVSTPAIAGVSAALIAARDAVHAGDTVLVVAQPFAGGYRIGWVGDVRAYAWDGAALRQLTKDHTLAQYFRDHGSPVTARMEHVVTTSVRTATPDRFGSTETAATGLLLTSDGVHKTLSLERMTDILRYASNPAEALIQAAVTEGSRDNATAVVLTPTASPATLPIPAAA